jgi:hypothetical protein
MGRTSDKFHIEGTDTPDFCKEVGVRRMSMTKSYTYNGTVRKDLKYWLKWIEDALEIFDILGVDPTECGVESDMGTSINSLKNLTSKMERLYEKGDNVSYITIIGLPEDYISVSGDFKVTITRYSYYNSEYVTCIINSKYCDMPTETQENRIIELLAENIEDRYGEVYEMDIAEIPEQYAGKEDWNYKTLNVLKKI